MKENRGVEYNYFWADTFLAMNKKEFEEFCEMYSEIKLPFWMQTRPETITDYNMKKLKEVGVNFYYLMRYDERSIIKIIMDHCNK